MEQILKEFKQGDKGDQLFYLAYLKRIGQIGKRLYKLKPEQWLEDFLIWLSSYINNYKIN